MSIKYIPKLQILIFALSTASSAQALQVQSGKLYKPRGESQCQGYALKDLPPAHNPDFYSHKEICVDSTNIDESDAKNLIHQHVQLVGYFNQGIFHTTQEVKALECSGHCDVSCQNDNNPLYECIQVKEGDYGCRNTCHRHPW